MKHFRVDWWDHYKNVEHTQILMARDSVHVFALVIDAWPWACHISVKELAE